MKTGAELSNQHNRIWYKLIARAKSHAKAAHPATGGLEQLAHNWGNAESKAVWARFWATWRKLDATYKRLSAEAEHREHTAKNWLPLWCDLCQGARARSPKCRKVATA